MDTTAIAAIVVVVALVLLAGAWWLMSQRKHESQLREQFGPEYDRAVEERGGKSAATKDLEARRERVSRLHIVELGPEDQRRYAEEWRIAQVHFVDDPSAATEEADDLVRRVMDKRGYPMRDFEQMAADVSVEHPNVVQEYRSAHDIAEKNHRDGASTEELRQAMVHYRTLFGDLLGVQPMATSR